jgi:site-specific DNA recombinase
MTVATMKEVTHVAKYLRISQEKRNEGTETLANHRSILTEFAKKQGYTFETYEEVLSGGASEMEARPQLQKLLDNIEKYDAIMVVELSRLSRNGLISETVLQICVDYDKPIITPEKVYDLANNNNDVLAFRFGSLIASQEHGLIGKRSKNNKITMAKQGLHVSGNVPFGYIRNPISKKLEINEAEAPTIRYIFKLHSEGKGAYTIRDILNKEGYKSATGKAFNLPSVKRIIRNEAYKGTTVFNDRKKVKKNGKFTYEILDTIRVENAHPAIVSPEVWDAVNRDRAERAEKAAITREKPAVKTGVTMLKDLMFCGCCGRKMTIRKDNKLKMHTLKKCEYLIENGNKCNNAGIKLEYVEKNVLAYMQQYTNELNKVLQTLDTDDASQVQAGYEQKLQQLDKRIKEVESDQKELINLALSGIFTYEELKEKKQELIDTLKHLQTEREQVVNEMGTVSVEDVKNKVKGIIAVLEKVEDIKDAEELNATLKTIIKKVHYKRVIPEELLKKSTRNPERKNYPFQLEIEYY